MSLSGCEASDHGIVIIRSGYHNGDHRLGSLSNRHLLSQFWRLEIKLLAGLLPSEASLLSLNTLFPASSPGCPSVSVCVNKHCLLDQGGGLHQPPGKGMQEVGEDVGFVTYSADAHCTLCVLALGTQHPCPDAAGSSKVLSTS